MICTNCLYKGKSKRKGSVVIMFLLLAIFFPLGILYAVLESTGEQNICPKCTKAGMIPEDSPKGIAIQKGTI